MSGQGYHDDAFLVHLLQQSDEQAFELLYNRYWEKLLTIAYHRTGCMETAKELVQDVFANLWKRRDSLRIKTTFAAYIFTAMRYTILDHIRSQAVQKKYIEAIKQTALETDNSTLNFIAYQELTGVLEQEISKLPEKCRIIFRMSRIEHYSTREIAERLDISPKTVENQLTKALKIIRTNLEEFTVLLALILTVPS
uniref:RNA polymerase sigma-70 factor n=1 Tax=Roseihalotalea indica TaxID=2867963 RepID=A0AA49JGX2_9BACT|nr:RNA polymerase sigma-70 factor [Tunicatimonas sp. TK19036]